MLISTPLIPYATITAAIARELDPNKRDAKIVGMYHDEIFVEVPAEQRQEATERIAQVMTEASRGVAPLEPVSTEPTLTKWWPGIATDRVCDIEDEDPRDWSKDSMAVIAANDDRGVVLYYVGAHLETEIDEIGTTDAEDLGILPDEPGIWIWQGKYVGGGYSPYVGDCDGWEPKGAHRAPTDEEWAAIRAGESPWNRTDWLLKTETTH